MAKKTSNKSFIPEEAAAQIERLNKLLPQTVNELESLFKAAVNVSGEFSKLSIDAKTMADLIEKHNDTTKKTTSVYNEQKRLINELVRLKQKLEAAERNLNRQNIQAKIDLQALNREQKLRATMLSAYTTQLEKLIAEQERWNRVAQYTLKTKGEESKLYQTAAGKAKNLGDEISKLQMQTGKMAGKMGSATYATFSLTQLMRELPNFAISTRIGFMAISNNLPQLADGFKFLANSVDATGKKLGNWGALKTFAKSLLSINTILVAASTLVIMYGDEVMEVFTGKVGVAKKAHQDFMKSLKDGNNELTKAFTETARLKAILENVDGVYITATDALNEYNNSIGKNLGETQDLATAHQNLIDKTEDYVKAMGMMAYANTILEVAVNKASEAEAKRRDKQVKWYNKLFGGFNSPDIDIVSFLDKDGNEKQFDRARQERLYSNTNMPDYKIKSKVDIEEEQFNRHRDILRKIIKENENASRAEINVLFKRAVQADNLQEEANQGIREYFELFGELSEFAAGADIDLFPNSDKDEESKRTIEKAKDMYIKRVYYDERRAALINTLAQAEQDKQKTTTEGILNDFKQREAAATNYYASTLKLNGIDADTAIRNSEETRDAEIRNIQEAIDANKEKYVDINKIREDVIKKENKYLNEEAELRKKYKGKEDSEEFKREMEALNKRRENNKKRITDAEKVNEGITKANNILRQSEENAIQNHNDRVLKINDDRRKKDLKAEKTYQQDIYQIRLDAIEQQTNLIKLGEKARSQAIEHAKKQLEQQMNNMNIAQIIASVFGFSNDTDFKQLDINYKATNAKLQNTKMAIEAEMALYKEGSEQREKLALELVKVEMDINDARRDYELEQETMLQEKMLDLKKKTAQEGWNFIDTLVDNSFERQNESLQRWNDEQTARIDRQLKSEVISKEQAEAQKMAIENQYAQKDLELRQKQARHDKLQALFEIGIRTAMGIVNYAATPLTAPLIPWVIGVGAAQAAVVAAKPIPEYFFGTSDHEGGLARVGERGQKELVVEPDKTWIATKDQIVNLKKHTKVIPLKPTDKRIMEIAAYAGINRDMQTIVVQENKEQLKKTDKTNHLLKQLIAKQSGSAPSRGVKQLKIGN
ncbi:hypothetical protein D0T49_04285 [Paludibacter sp. 221]|uniref:hypothetical protein n=1 Tax=Paludibacter sp. 221 TaxID=2302939 RepID=UPI0013D1E321|nr:hypothetical protein [Paludibacter sp. 221]NDV46258.1 hypothetical protein [Paludibacter sp. 221]